MDRNDPARGLGVGLVLLTQAGRWLGLSLLTALLVALGFSTLMTVSWLVLDEAAVWSDAPYAWLGLFALTLAFGLPGTVLFGIVVAPLAALGARRHSLWSLVLSGVGGGLLVLLTTKPLFAPLGVVGGLLYHALAHRRTLVSL